MDLTLLFIHLSAERHLGYFCFPATINNTAVNVHLQEFLWTYIFSSLRRIPRRGIAGKSIFHHLRTCQIVYQSGSTILPLNGCTIHSGIHDRVDFSTKIHLYFLFQKKKHTEKQLRVLILDLLQRASHFVCINKMGTTHSTIWNSLTGTTGLHLLNTMNRILSQKLFEPETESYSGTMDPQSQESLNQPWPGRQNRYRSMWGLPPTLN